MARFQYVAKDMKGKIKKGSDGTQRTWNPAAFCAFRLFHAAYRPDTKSATSADFF